MSSAHIVGSGQSKEHREKNETHHLLVSSAHIVGSGQSKEHREKNETHHLLVSSAHIVGSGRSKEHREKNETHHLLFLCLSLRSLLCITSHYLNTWNRVKCNFGIMLRYKR